MKFRLLSYNIHKGIGGVDRRYDLERVIETINHYDPDVALLQEVDDGVPRSRRHRQVDLLSDATRMPHRLFQANVHLKIGQYGNAILSRHPLQQQTDVDLTIPLKKRRRALSARCRMSVGRHHKTVVLVNVHLGLAGVERQMQLRRLLAHQCVDHLRQRTPLIVGGDYNDVWSTLGRRVMQPRGFELADGAGATFPAAMPIRRLDRVFYRGDLRVHHALAGRTQLARQASDHLPLVVDFEFTRK